ncbi:hypothetical protein EFK50_01160 [Nocardioides marmoriginsengisoli]|uniref:Uncharacterized protein n=1 Tax=Nocardioides marmoriginsengisoli TaxID=661483 RepID=A0A3N0CS46_9ACTN|nr:hypothetical protein [Nocardioides marmoriginsengisoli]RNL66265.1 hypothetical protein EFK50_01160 [Nocardioides marmoriginsengisoli]
MSCTRCGHRTHPRTKPNANPLPKTRAAAWSLTELMETPRLVNLIRKRPDLADRALLGARIAAATLENA